MTTTVTVPTPPVFPVKWTPATIAGYIASVVTFVLGVLTSLGVTVPTGISTDAEVVSGAIVTIVGAVTAVVTTLSQHKLTAAALKAS